MAECSQVRDGDTRSRPLLEVSGLVFGMCNLQGCILTDPIPRLLEVTVDSPRRREVLRLPYVSLR